jgi:hypothetical protein
MIMLVAQRDPSARGPRARSELYPVGTAADHHADAQAARRADPHPRPGAVAGARRPPQPDGALPAGQDRRGSRSPRPEPARSRSRRWCAASRRPRQDRRPRQGDLARGDGDRRQPRGPGPARRPRRLATSSSSSPRRRRSSRRSTRSRACAGQRDPHREIQLLTMQQEISTQARGEMDRSQREYFLRQQLKAIQQELGEGDELAEEIERLPQGGRRRDASRGGQGGARQADPRLERSHPESAETRSSAPTSTG